MAQATLAMRATAGEAAAGPRPGVRWRLWSAALGAALWLAAPFAPWGSPPAWLSLEHLFAFLPLVAAPLALQLLAELLEEGTSGPPLHRLARRAQPAAAALALASLFMAPGVPAAALAASWLAVALLVAVGGVPRVPRGGAHLSSASLLAAHLFLPVGAAWLLLSRLGVGPRSLAPTTVFLAALHFHFSGFTLQLLAAATGRRLPDRRPWLARLHRGLAAAAIAGIPLIAAGNLLPSRPLKLLGVAAMVLSALALAVTSAAVALEARQRAARALLLASAASLLAGMVLAGLYGAAELAGHVLLGVPAMAATHGLINALGFTLCGLLGHGRLQAEAAR
ncbi:MAG TPA: YndJ family transporter [Anaeromyxobacteraceae bacterium]|nr:YndJ family transporter [Anaeromyxobacteraceae bacterium]